jgi:hypothetical protein
VHGMQLQEQAVLMSCPAACHQPSRGRRGRACSSAAWGGVEWPAPCNLARRAGFSGFRLCWHHVGKVALSRWRLAPVRARTSAGARCLGRSVARTRQLLARNACWGLESAGD